MLRECHRVLRRGGRVASYVIHTPDGLGPDDARRATELGPPAVTPDPAAGYARAGFEIEIAADVTAAFEATSRRVVAAREQFASALRAAESDTVYEDESENKRATLEGITLGLLRRSLIVGVKP